MLLCSSESLNKNKTNSWENVKNNKKCLDQIHLKKIKDKVDFIEEISIIIDVLLEENEYKEDFFVRFYRLKDVVNEKLTLSPVEKFIFSQMIHSIENLNIRKPYNDLKKVGEEIDDAYVDWLIKTHPNRIDFKRYLLIFKWNNHNEYIQIEDINSICINSSSLNTNWINSTIINNTKNSCKERKVNICLLKIILENIFSNYQRYWENWEFEIIFYDDYWEIRSFNDIKNYNEDKSIWTWRWNCIMADIIRKHFKWKITFWKSEDWEIYSLHATCLEYK